MAPAAAAVTPTRAGNAAMLPPPVPAPIAPPPALQWSERSISKAKVGRSSLGALCRSWERGCTAASNHRRHIPSWPAASPPPLLPHAAPRSVPPIAAMWSAATSAGAGWVPQTWGRSGPAAAAGRGRAGPPQCAACPARTPPPPGRVPGARPPAPPPAGCCSRTRAHARSTAGRGGRRAWAAGLCVIQHHADLALPQHHAGARHRR